MAHATWATITARCGSPDAALRLLPSRVATRTGFAGALYNQGNALLDLDRAEEALASFDRAVTLQPDYAEAYNNRGNALLRLGETSGGARELSPSPDTAARFRSRAWATVLTS